MPHEAADQGHGCDKGRCQQLLFGDAEPVKAPAQIGIVGIVDHQMGDIDPGGYTAEEIDGSAQEGIPRQVGMACHPQHQGGHQQEHSDGQLAASHAVPLQHAEQCSQGGQTRQFPAVEIEIGENLLLILPQENTKAEHGQAKEHKIAHQLMGYPGAGGDGHFSQGNVEGDQSQAEDVQRGIVHSLFAEEADIEPKGTVAQENGGQVP